MIRLFVAIPMPGPVQSRLAMLGGGLPGAKWVPAENLHLTLRFIGGVDGRTFADILDALGHVDGTAFEVTLEGIGTFGDRRRVDSVWAGVKPNEALTRLQGKVEQAVRRAGLEPEGRKFHPHVTLARLKGAPEARVAAYVADRNLFSIPPFRVEDFVLFSSFLSQSGAIYQPEATYPLRG